MLEKPISEDIQGLKNVSQRVVVPDSAKRDVPNGTILPTNRGDLRRFSRRTSNLQASLEILTAWKLDEGSERLFEVPVSNVSRNGACFLHHAQLYPDDQVILDFGKLRRQYQVTRCRRLGDDCFEIGVQVASN